MVEEGAGLEGHGDVHLADFRRILFAAMAALGVIALVWAFAEALSVPTRPGSLPAPVSHMLHKLR